MIRSQVILGMVFVGLAQGAFATEVKMNKVDFVAPIVQSHAALPGDTPFGAIVYDNTASAFMGLSAIGTWQSFGGGANASLSNLTMTAVNADISPASDNSVNLGSSSLRFATVNANHGVFEGGRVYTAPIVMGYGLKSNAVSSLSGQRAVYLDVNAIDSNESSRLEITAGDGANINIAINNGPGVIETPNHIRSYPHVQYGSASASVQSAAGTAGSCSLGFSTDVAGSVSVSTSGSSVVAGEVCRISFAQTYKAAPKCILTATNATAGANAQATYITTTTSAILINFGTAGASSATYTFDYICLEVSTRD